jgi:DNA mismatch endonuclease (patch repair protein)
MDIWSKAKRSQVMSRIKGRDTKPELIVRSLLHRAGVRFSLRRKDLPGRPDIVLPRFKAVIFVHGCFWHRHEGCKVASNPKTRKVFWNAKFNGNVARDKRNIHDLRQIGWKVKVVWECEVMKDPQAVLSRLLAWLGATPKFSYDQLPDRHTLLKVAEEKLQWKLGQVRLERGG